MQRTIRLHLSPSAGQALALTETCRQFTSAFNQAAAMGWEAEIGNATTLHYLAYYPVNRAHPTLVADLINRVPAGPSAPQGIRPASRRPRRSDRR